MSDMAREWHSYNDSDTRSNLIHWQKMRHLQKFLKICHFHGKFMGYIGFNFLVLELQIH